MRCKHPNAEPFVDWVCGVLEEIRGRGFYAMPGAIFPQPVPQIMYIKKSHKQLFEEESVLKCGCPFDPSKGTLDEQCVCPNKEKRKKECRWLKKRAKQLEGNPERVLGGKGRRKTQQNIRERKVENIKLHIKVKEKDIRIAKLELLLLNLNLNGDDE